MSLISKRWKRRNRHKRTTVVYLFNRYRINWIRLRKFWYYPVPTGFWFAYEVSSAEEDDTWFIDLRIREEKYVHNIL